MIAGLRGEVAAERLLAIGDGVATDIAGAAGGRACDRWFVASGIHVERGRQLDQALLDALFRDLGDYRPVAAMAELRWS